MSYLEFEVDSELERENLKKQAQKAWKKYSTKYEGSKLRNAVFRNLAAKGFEYDEVYNVVEEVEREHDKD